MFRLITALLQCWGCTPENHNAFFMSSFLSSLSVMMDSLISAFTRYGSHTDNASAVVTSVWMSMRHLHVPLRWMNLSYTIVM